MGVSAIPSYSASLCHAREENHYEDEEVRRVMRGGLSPAALIRAARLVREREKSPLLKLNLDIIGLGEESLDSIEALPEIVEIACSAGAMRVTLDCMENAKTEAILLKVQAPFSALMALLGSNRMFRWICRYPAQMHDALRRLTESTAQHCLEAVRRGTSIVSLADPSGIFELLGEKRYREFSAFYVLSLLHRLEPHLENALVHLCPRTSLILERLRLVTSDMFTYERSNYADTVYELSQYSGVRIMGHRCINAELSKESRVFILTANRPDVTVREMRDGDWTAVAAIYGQGIRSGNATIVKELPTFGAWKQSHGLCLVAEYLGSVVGFIALNTREVPEISVYTAEEFQKKGVGTALLGELQRRAHGAVRSLIFDGNAASLRLHEKMGFIPAGSFYFDGDERLVWIYEWSPDHA